MGGGENALFRRELRSSVQRSIIFTFSLKKLKKKCTNRGTPQNFFKATNPQAPVENDLNSVPARSHIFKCRPPLLTIFF